MCGPVFGYASTIVDDQQIAYVGPLTPGANWRRLWQMAERCHTDGASKSRKAQWIVSQASRTFICGSEMAPKFTYLPATRGMTPRPHSPWQVK
ncbi:hypothetical protein [Streptomyces cyaneus]|uniref:hypothetical protein n=1 Tax=Streptomyces cyaneus TaxID=1904 RepID=UPI000FF886AF|nr:hypothetical protein [Streptomyces cyaneus]